jgi:hypothetical protein
MQPQWSPDGRLIAYVRLVIDTVPPQETKDLSWFEGLLFRRHSGEVITGHYALWVVPSAGGRPKELKSSLPGETLCGPGGSLSNGLAVAWTPDSSALVYAEPLPAPPEREPGATATSATHTETGYGLRLRAIRVADGKETDLALLRASPLGQFHPSSGGQLVMSATDAQVALFGHDQGTGAPCVGLIGLQDGQLRQVIKLPAAEPGASPWLSEFTLGGTGRVYFLRRFESADPAANKGRYEFIAEPKASRYEIWSAGGSARAATRETAGPSDCHPTPAPTDERLSFVRLGSVCLRQPDGSVSTLVERGHRGGTGHCDSPVAWSPDGTKIAFVWNVDLETSLWTASVAAEAGED